VIESKVIQLTEIERPFFRKCDRPLVITDGIQQNFLRKSGNFFWNGRSQVRQASCLYLPKAVKLFTHISQNCDN